MLRSILTRQFRCSSFGFRNVHSRAHNRRFYRNYMGAAFLLPPKITTLRVLVTGGMTAIGYISYKLNNFSDWLGEMGVAAVAFVGGFGAELGSLLKDVQVRRQPGKLLGVAATAAEEALEFSASETSNTGDTAHFNDFIKKMLEIRDSLRIAGCQDSITLPNIVVIGSQSSGKSSVLESIVGHEFLPKGQNMVTRRPLELTLVHEPAEPRQRVSIHGHSQSIYDFTQVQQILHELNAAVPEGEWVSSEPIKMTIHSAQVPDLTLVDLPGYIQVTNRAQPPILRDKIRQLCDSYIRSENNIILAVSAADVDLANSEALKASRKYDPRGRRTIGVLTKLDLVEAQYAAQLIVNEDYPLQLGYVGVVCPPLPTSSEPQSTQRSFKELLHLSAKREDPRAAQERAYFNQNAPVYAPVTDRVGIPALRRILTASLERAISDSLQGVIKQVQSELNELRYQLKAQFSDRFVSPEAYLSELTSAIRQDFTHLGHRYTRAQIEKSLREAFNARLFQLCDDLFWQQSSSTTPTVDPWRQLKNSLAGLTRSGVGRFCTLQISESIRSEMLQIFAKNPLSYHLALKARLQAIAEANLKDKCAEATDQVENALKPFKTGIEFTQSDWRTAKKKFLAVFEGEARKLAIEIEAEKKAIGAKKLKRAVEHLMTQQDDAVLDSPLLKRAQEVVLKTAQLKRYSERLKALKVARQLDNLVSIDDFSYRRAWSTRIYDFLWPESIRPRPVECVYEADAEGQVTVFKDPRQVEAPEVYLFLVMDRFLAACVPFLHHELVTEFLLPLPDQLVSAEHDGALSLTRMSRGELALLIKENPDIAEQLEMQERRRALDLALSKLTSMQK